MAARPKFRSDAFEAIHDNASGMFRAGTMDKATTRHFDETCLTAPIALAPADIEHSRESNHVGQPVFARYLNTSESIVEKWESRAKKPSGFALKLLTVIRKHGLEVLS